MCGLNGVFETVFIIHPLGCNRDRCLEVTVQEFPLPLGILPPFTVWSRHWIFAWWFVNLGRVNPNYSSHSSAFDASWLIGRTPTKYGSYTLESLLFLVSFQKGVLVKKKTLKEPLSVQVDLNRRIKEGFILLWLLKQMMIPNETEKR